MMNINFIVNGKKISAEIKPYENLARVLRRLGYVEVKIGCEAGDCGACCVILNGQSVNSCMVFAAAADGGNITTVAGIGSITFPHPLQEAYVECGAVQCGYCTPGSIVSAKNLLDRNPHPDDDEIKTALSGNICRCTGYYKQIEAVKLAAEKIANKKKEIPKN